jgi:hypothetical protein
MNKYFLALTLIAVPCFAQQVNVPVSNSFPVATGAQAGMLSPQDWTTFNSKQPALGFSPENITNKNKVNGYAGLDGSGKFPWAQINNIPALQPVLGFTPENPANKNKPNGYAGLDAAGSFPWAQISNVPTASATTSGCLKVQDWITFNAKENPANKNVPNGYAGLDASGLIPGNLIVWSHISNVPNASATVKGPLIPADWITFNSKQAALGYTPENPANRDQPKGYPSLDANGKILPNELPTNSVQVLNEVFQVPTPPVPSYTLLNANVVGPSVVAYRNGLRIALNGDYSISGSVVTFSALPAAGDTFVFDYQHQ